MSKKKIPTLGEIQDEVALGKYKKRWSELADWCIERLSGEVSRRYAESQVNLALKNKKASGKKQFTITKHQLSEIKDAGETLRAMMGNYNPEADEGFLRHVRKINSVLKRNGFEQISTN